MEPEIEQKTPAYMDLAKVFFVLRSPSHRGDVELGSKLLAGIEAGNMAPYYREVSAQLGWTMDEVLLEKMEEANRAQLSQYDEDVVERHEGDDDAPTSWHEKLLYLCSIGAKDAAVALATAKSHDQTLSLNRRLDATFALYRVAFFHGCDVRAMRAATERVAQLMEASGSGGDWSARNKLKAYEAVCGLAVREYAAAAPRFLDALPTYESAELLSFQDFFRYAVVTAMIALPRGELRDRLLRPGVVPQTMHSHAGDLREFFTALYHCQYAAFFRSLAAVEAGMKLDPVLQPHYRHYVREMRVRAYTQLLCAYRSLSLGSMAEAFGVSEDLIEREVARFAASGRLRCKIDHVGRRVHTDDQDAASATPSAPSVQHHRMCLYQGVIKKGDNLLNRLNNLTRVLDV